MPRKKLTDETITAEETAETVAESPKGRRRTAAPIAAEEKAVTTRRRAKATVAAVVVEGGEEDDLPLPQWRPRSPTAEATPVAAPVRAGPKRRLGSRPTPPPPMETETEGFDDVTAVFRPRSAKSPEPEGTGDPASPKVPARRRSRRESEPVPVTEVSPPVVATPAPVIAVEVKPPILIPEEAPQVVLREGVPVLVRNRKALPPLIFFGNAADEHRTQTVLEELRLASEAGIHLHALLVEFEVDMAAVEAQVEYSAYLLSKAVALDPEAQLLFRLAFVAPKSWESKYPDARYRTSDGSIAEPSICDDGYWEDAAKCLELYVRKLRRLEHANHILGVHLERGEWFMAAGVGYDDSPAAKRQFRQWARTRYLNDVVALRASWFDGDVTFDSIEVPEFQPEGAEGDRFVRSSRKQRPYIDYHLFLSDATVARIGDLAYAAKSASQGYFLVGASYGYTFEWSYPSSGHLALGKLLRTQEIDFIAGPPSYRSREPGGTGAFPVPIDSVALNGKLYFSEEDYKTSLAETREADDDFNPKLKTPQALESVHWRGVGAALSHCAGAAWMDLWGNGWLRSPGVWHRAERVRRCLIQRLAAARTDPDVAVFIDERSLAYLVDPNAFELLVQNLRESVLRAGVSAGFYLLSDLAHREIFPEAKLYLFLNAWDVRPELRAAVKSRLQGNNKVLFWLYAAGLFDSGRASLERAREVTGIALKPQPFHSKAGTTLLNRRHPLTDAFPDRSLVADSQLEPSYFAIPEDATVLGEYTQTGLPSFVIKEIREDPDGPWTSIFLGEPVVNAALVRSMAQMAGAHVFSFHGDVVHVQPPFLTVHCTGSGPRAIALPDKHAAYDVINDHWVALDSPNIRFTAIDGATHVFLVGTKAEIEHLLNLDEADVLTFEKLPPREQNVRHDTTNFEVPIIKLGEFMGGAETDEVADEWFLRPPAPEPTPELEERDPRAGRRRRRRNRGERHEDRPGKADHMDPELNMGVMFRRRE
jgi:hypothetical protein